MNNLASDILQRLPSLAAVMCVRDEEEFLAANLTYHYAVGVSRVYVFLDRCADATAEIARSFPFARVISADRDDELTQLTCYQIKCANSALNMAREEGIDWLLHIDADEFAWGNNLPNMLSRVLARCRFGQESILEQVGSLPAALATIRPNTEMVLLRPKEVIPLATKGDTPFWELHYFQDGGTAPRPMLNPLNGEIRQLNKWIGHKKGKSIVRTAADVQPFSSHLWTRKQETAQPRFVELPTERKGCLYHFVITSARHWQAKYRKLAEYPAHWGNGRSVGFPTQCWKEASVVLTERDARSYFDQWIAVRPHELFERFPGKFVVRENYVEEILKRAGYIDTTRVDGENSWRDGKK